MALSVRKLHPAFAGEAIGVDLARPLGEETIRDIVAALDEHAVLVFPGQKVEPAQQVALGQQMGKLLLIQLRKVNPKGHRTTHPALSDISNVGDDGKVADRNSRSVFTRFANQLWHTDASFQKPPARYSMLYSVTTTPTGGETEFADMRAAYDALPDDLKAQISNLSAEHFALHSRISLGYTDYTEDEKTSLPPVSWPLVRTHPGSGRKSLYIGAYVTQIVGMNIAEGRLLHAELLERSTQREFVYRHCWQPGDLVMYDNRCTLHRGLRYDVTQRRELRRITTEDTQAVAAGSAEEQATTAG